jgi:hypothetical protein
MPLVSADAQNTAPMRPIGDDDTESDGDPYKDDERNHDENSAHETDWTVSSPLNL